MIRRSTLLLPGLLCAVPALAEPPSRPAPTLQTVQVTATRTAKPVSSVPAAITTIPVATVAVTGLGVNLSEKLAGVAGVFARERQNLAQDVQISIRGFGARSSFGIRGLRLYLDGIPATMPDGQGQVSHFNLSSAGRIEVLRGPFSALYGNASGGVIQMFSADGAADPGTRLALVYGSDDASRQSLNFRGVRGALDYNIDLTRFATDGYREHGNAERNWFNAKLKLQLEHGGTVTVLANALASPQALDPLGLSAAQLADAPRQAALARQFNTRKALQQDLLGITWQQPISEVHSIRVLAYAGTRRVSQFLAIPAAAQSNPLHGGGVVDLASRFSGLDGRWVFQASLAARPLELIIGVNYDQQDQHRLGFNNFLGASLGVRGLLRRDQQDYVRNFDQYAQANWSAHDRVNLLLGLRHSTVRFDSRDRYITAANPDDSGRLAFSATTPVLGISFRPVASLSLYAALGSGFETPTFDELGYRLDGKSGLNFSLRAARTRSGEIGAKSRLPGNANLDLALFRADTDDELAVANNAGGRSTFQNVGRARREGLELSLAVQPGKQWHSRLTYTRLSARFRDPFLACNSNPCATPTVSVPAGSQIPGVAGTTIYLEQSWQGNRGWQASLTGQYVASLAVNNVGDARTHPYSVFDAEFGRSFRSRRGDAKCFARVGNLLARSYAGSVVVNESNRRYYEPAPGRNVLLGCDWHL